MDSELKYSVTVCIGAGMLLYSSCHLDDIINSYKDSYPSLNKPKNKAFLMSLGLILPMTTALKFIKFMEHL